MSSSRIMSGLLVLWTIYSLAIIHSVVNAQEGQSGDSEASCICNPEDNNTGAVCANDGKTYTSACDFRLKQGLRSDLGIRCVGSCPCDDSLIGVGVDCGTTAISQLTTPSTGLEFCGTNAVTYNNENMFMCDQVQDTSLAISCPGSCPCQLADCPSLSTERPGSRLYATTAPPRVMVYPPAAVLPNAYNRPLSPASPMVITPSQTGYGSVQAQGGYGNRVSDSVPAVIIPAPAPISYTQPPAPWTPTNWSNRPQINVVQQGFAPAMPTLPQVPALVIQTRPMAPPAGPSGYGAPSGGEAKVEAEIAAPPVVQIRDLHVREKGLSSATAAPSTLPQAAYNPLTEALRSVPFRLFRHLYILITVASEGMKQIPFQIAKNMQARLPPYVREIPMQLAEATQEALAIHFDSLARQVKDTVDAVRTLLDNDNS